MLITVAGSLVRHGVPNLSNVHLSRLEIEGDELRYRSWVRVQLRPGDRLVGERYKWYVAPGDWKVVFDLAGDRLSGYRLITPGVGLFLERLAVEPGWMVQRERRRFEAIYRPHHGRSGR